MSDIYREGRGGAEGREEEGRQVVSGLGVLHAAYYSTTEAFRAIHQHAAVVREDGSLVAVTGPSTGPGAMDALATAILFAQAPKLLSAVKASEKEYRSLVARHDQTLRELDTAQVRAGRLEREVDSALRSLKDSRESEAGALRERDALKARVAELNERVCELCAERDAALAFRDEALRQRDAIKEQAATPPPTSAQPAPELEAVVDSVLDALEGVAEAHVRGFNEGLEAAAALVEERVGTSVGYGLRLVSAAEVAGELRAKKVGA